MWRSYRVALVLSMLSVAGCVTDGRDFNSDVTWIKEGKTTKQDVQLMLREPYSVGNSSGRPTWTYGFYRYKLIGKSQLKELKIYWNPTGTIDSFSFSSSFPDDIGAAGGQAPDLPKKDHKPTY